MIVSNQLKGDKMAKAMKAVFICGLCKKKHNLPHKATMCCWKKKRDMGILNPGKTKAQLERMAKSASIRILKKRR